MTWPPSPSSGERLGIVIPTLNEEEALPLLLDDLSHLSLPTAVVVADGGSEDGTVEAARGSGARILRTPPGRARQMNAGARALRTPWLLFLHADVRLPRATARALDEWLAAAQPGELGWFDFELQGAGWFWRFIETGQRVRERLGKLVYGDQGLLVSRDLFEEAGGYPELPLMEDVELFRRLRGLGRPRKIPAPLLSSPRRYEEEGRWRGWLRNTTLIALYLGGVRPERLARFYPSRGRRPEAAGAGQIPPHGLERGAGTGDTLIIFAKEPVPGRVKTRLAAAVGPEEAARIYRKMGREVVDQLRNGPYRTVVCFDPPGAEPAVREWLGAEKVEFTPQSPGGLGERVRAAVSKAFSRSERVVVVGTDAPDVDRAVVAGAFRRLDEADIVVGPARDGGYYLLGVSSPSTRLFEAIPWSTEKVLEETLSRAEEAGLSVALLPVLSDVDTAEDWRERS